MDKITGSGAAKWATLLGLAMLVAIAFFVRVQFIAVYGGGQNYLEWALANYFGRITPQYLADAHSILSGQGSLSTAYPPGYSLFIAGAQLLGVVELQHIRLLQAFIDSLTLLGIYWLLRRLGANRGLALAGSGVYAIFAEWAGGSTFLLAEWFSPSIIVWLLVLLVAAVGKATYWRWGAIGLLIAIGALIRPDLLLLIIPAVLWLLLGWKQAKNTKMLGLVILILCFLLPLGSWGGYNKINHGNWIFTSTSGGAGLWEGLADTKNDYGYILSDTQTIKMLSKRGFVWHTVPADKYLKERYTEALFEHPLYVLQVAAWRWKQIATQAAIGFSPGIFVGTHGVQKLFEKYLKDAAIWVWLAAMIISWRKPTALLIVGLPLIYALISIGLVHYESRYVRYAHLSYLFAPVILLVALPRLLRERQAWWLSRVVGFAALIVFLYCAVPYISYLWGTAQVKELPLKAAEGKLKRIADLHSMDFKRPVINEVTKKPDGSLLVRTDQSTYAYQLMSRISLDQAKFLYIPFDARILHGGLAVGLLGPDFNWLTQKVYGATGNVNGFIGIPVQNEKFVTLVITNYCQKPCQTEFALKSLKVYVEK